MLAVCRLGLFRFSCVRVVVLRVGCLLFLRIALLRSGVLGRRVLCCVWFGLVAFWLLCCGVVSTFFVCIGFRGTLCILRSIL